MARPIAPIPILKNEEAEKFIEEVDNPRIKEVPEKDVLKAKEIYTAVISQHESQ